MRLGDRADDRQPEAGAVAARAAVQALEGLEQRGDRRLRDHRRRRWPPRRRCTAPARRSVRTSTRPARAGCGARRSRRGWRRGARAAGGRRAPARRPRSRVARPGARRRPRRRSGRARARARRRGRPGRGAATPASERASVSSAWIRRSVAVGRVAHRLGHLAQLGVRGVGVGERDVELGADHAQRRAQLVRGVGHEAPLAGERGRQALEHPVEGVGQLLELVARALQGDALAEVVLRDALGRRRDALQRAQHAAGHAPSRAAPTARSSPRSAIAYCARRLGQRVVGAPRAGSRA